MYITRDNFNTAKNDKLHDLLLILSLRYSNLHCCYVDPKGGIALIFTPMSESSCYSMVQDIMFEMRLAAAPKYANPSQWTTEDIDPQAFEDYEYDPLKAILKVYSPSYISFK